jgi:hypothetical protein
MRPLFLLLALSTLLSACGEDFFSQTVEIDPPAYERQIAIHLFGSTLDTALNFTLSRNFGILENTPDSLFFIKNAMLEILEDGVSRLRIVPQRFFSSSSSAVAWQPTGPDFFKAGKTYDLRVSHPEYPSVSATQRMPNPPQVDSVRIRPGGSLDPSGDRLQTLDVYLKDPPGEKNFYALTASSLYYFISPVYDLEGNIIRIDTFGSSFNQLYPESSDDPNAQVAAFNMIVVSDQFFDGQAYKMVFKSFGNFGSGGEQSVQVRVASITEEMYVHAITALRKANAEDVPFAEPVAVFNNIQGGIGLFGLMNERAFTVQ